MRKLIKLTDLHNLVAQFTILKDAMQLMECTHTGERSVVVV